MRILKIVIFLVSIGVLAVATFAILKPQEKMFALQDETRLHEIGLIAEALQVYADEHEGDFPNTLNNTAPLTKDELRKEGIKASQLDELAPDYLSFVPLDPHGNEYLVGILDNGSVIAGTELSTGEFATYPE